MSTLDTHNLQAFVAVAACESFSQAADQLHLSQPAISKRINLLEQQLETRLFERIGRRVILTAAGRSLLPRARHILEAIDQAEQDIKDLADEVRGELRLVTSHHVGLHRLPDLLRRYLRQHPRVRPDIQFMDSRQAYLEVLAGTFDLGIVTRGAAVDTHIISENLWQDTLVFVAAADHPLARMKHPTLEAISAWPALLPDTRFYTTQIVENQFRQHGLPLNILMSTNYLETIKALLGAGYAWGVLPRIMLGDSELVPLAVDAEPMVRPIDCIYHRDRSLGNPARAMLDLLHELAGETPAS